MCTCVECIGDQPEPQLGDVIERRQGPSGVLPDRRYDVYRPLYRPPIKGVFERVFGRKGCFWRYVAKDANNGAVLAIMEMEEGDNTSTETLWHLREHVSNFWRQNRSWQG